MASSLLYCKFQAEKKEGRCNLILFKVTDPKKILGRPDIFDIRVQIDWAHIHSIYILTVSFQLLLPALMN